MHGMEIKAVIFDMDGLMFDTERVAGIGMIEALAAQGLAADESFFIKLLGLNTESTRAALTQAFGDRVNFPAAMAGMDGYLERYVTEHGTPVKPGLLALLERLGERKLPCAVASGSPMPRILRNLEMAGLTGRFDAIVAADDVPRGKPAPDVFLAAAKALGIEPARCMVLEDSAAGVEAGKRAGMKTVMVPDLHAPDETDRNGLYALAQSLYDVIPLLD
jgi:HAD superfamily hydrolase (TIGR01509 family)